MVHRVIHLLLAKATMVSIWGSFRNFLIREVLMLQFWEAGKAQRGDELMGVDMLLFDVKITFVTVNPHASHRERSPASQFQGSPPGCGFDITRCNQNFRLSDSLMTILFSDSTNLDVLTEPYSPIPVKRFRNVIGELTAVKSTAGVTSLAQGAQRSSNERCHPCVTCSNTMHQTIAGTSLSGRHQETLGIKVFKGGQEAT
ncbi:hypothetical protein F2Q68_00028861 [Brassica cretica]|uniref:Uncharacterized protein n=1 Tax=Brassica cretica TaxID=69181 RepID=A0A8S9GE75_BRACR|nr:hypothetical protein F2Q68_00028861 [Brassica cretica]